MSARRVARALLAIGAGGALAGLALEGVLRAGGAPPAVASPLHGFHRSDPVLGWAGTPRLRRRFVRPDFDVVVEHGADGFRRPDPAPPAAARERWLVLGDSLVWGWGVAQGELFTDHLQRALAPQVAVVNRGVNAYATSQELLLLERELGRGAWSRVLLVFTPSDLEENVDGKQGRRPLFHVDGDRLVASGEPLVPLIGAWRLWWKDASLAYLWLELAGNRTREWLSRGSSAASRAPRELRGAPGAPITARLLAETAARARGAGARFHVVHVPADAALAAGPPDPLAEAAFALLATLAEREALPLVDLTPLLAERSRGRSLTFPGDAHPDARGHRLIADALLAALPLAPAASP